jgi:hypothetical protein
MGKKRKKGRRRSPAPLPARRSGSPSGDTFAPPVARESVSTIGELRPDPRNARRHGPRNVETIAAALAEVGAARSIVIDESGVILETPPSRRPRRQESARSTWSTPMARRSWPSGALG